MDIEWQPCKHSSPDLCLFQPNHLVGLRRYYLKLSFLSVEDLTKVKRDIQPAVRKNKERDKSTEVYTR